MGGSPCGCRIEVTYRTGRGRDRLQRGVADAAVGTVGADSGELSRWPSIGISSDAGYINPQGREVFNQRWGSVEEFRGEAALVFRDLFSTGQTLDREGR